MLREEPRRDLTSRSLTIRAATANEADRSVEASLASETPVDVFDWSSERVIEEVLLISGARMVPQLPLLANHNRYSLDSILGSARDLRADQSQIFGRLVFASDEESQRAWEKVLGGHLTDVSVGYRVLESVTIPAGQSATVAGRNFTANPRRSLRVVTDWQPKEVSLVPIGADASAKIRGDQPFQPKETLKVNPKLRRYLESIGLRAEADEAEAQKFYADLTDQQRADADTAAAAQRSAPTPSPNPTPVASPTPAVDLVAIRSEATAAERNRVRTLNEMAGTDVPREMVERAVTEGWDEARASREFLGAVRASRAGTPVERSHGPAIHSRSMEGDLNARSLAAALIARSGGNPLEHRMYDTARCRRGDPLTEQDADRGDRFLSVSAVDLCRMCVQLDGGQFSYDHEESVRSAVSGGTLQYVFGTNVYARIVAGWQEVPDSTDWCVNEPDIPNFLLQEDITLGASASLDRLQRGGTANHASQSDSHETYRLARYAKQFVADEQDFLDDRLGAILQMPFEMGQAARRLRPDLVYSTLLENPTLVADSGALFNATAVTTAGGHANLGTGALGTTTFATAIQAMYEQRQNGIVLQLRPRYLIVPGALMFTAASILNGIALAKTHATKSDPDYVPINPVSNAMLQMLQQQQVELRIDDRIGASGVIDPRSKSPRLGSATNWFVSSGGSRTIRVGTRRGTGGMPVMRQYTLDRGQWGLGWDINYDVCAIVADYPGLYKSTGTG
jgi:hypothetical protein